ncbi:MAG: hypothetical protein H0W81_00435 [Chloroflexi bacterium]|nr:hypothetical protein [Chloroflexota bacterium]
MVSPKVTRPAPRNVVPRHRGHSLAPEHLGERGAGAALVIAIGGTAIFIGALAMTVSGLTLPSRWAGADAPPNVGQLGFSQVVGGIGLLVLGVLMVGSSLALLAGLPRSRPFAVVISAISALLALAGFLLLLVPTRRDLVLLSALGVAVVAFGGAAVILARLRR